jgi:prepilin-type N-terminal cleavage/methylation domain-containing protein
LADPLRGYRLQAHFQTQRHGTMKSKTMKHQNAQRGFTLIEIMVVMVILGLLVAIVAPNK